MATEGLDIQIDGASFRKTMHTLDLFAPELRKDLVKELRGIASSLKSGAAGRFPVGRTGQGQGGFKSSVRVRGDDVSGSVFNMTRQGQILEFVGSASSGSTTQGQSLIRSLTAKYGPPGRFMWEEYDSRNVPNEVDAVIANAERKLQGDLNRADA